MGSDSTVWITGANGFLGQHLTDHFLAANRFVIGFGRRTETFEDGQFAQFRLDKKGLQAAFDLKGSPEHIFHLAGGATVGASIADPSRDFESNVATTNLILDFIRINMPDIPVVVASSAAVYGDRHTRDITTNDAQWPSSPYGHHKQMAEQLVRSRVETFGLRATILRLFSVYGPKIRKQLLFDLCTRLSGSKDPLLLGGTGKERRDWVHATDAVRAMAMLDIPPEGCTQIYNVGTGTGTEIATIAGHMADIWGERHEVHFSGQARAGDPFSLIAAPESLPPGFQPQVDLQTGLQEFVYWYRLDAKRQ